MCRTGEEGLLSYFGRDKSIAGETFGRKPNSVGAIKAGKIQWAVDQQFYLQSYLTVDSVWSYKTNVAKVAEFAAKGTR